MVGIGGGASIKDVSREAAVSVSTVSHVLNGTRFVSPELRARVEDAVARLGYRHNGLARSLRTRRSYAIGLIIPDVSNPYYPQMARGIQDTADAFGYTVFLCNSDRRPENEVRLLAALEQRRVDGIILDAAGPTPQVLEALAQRREPVVLVGSRIEPAHFPDADIVQTAPDGGREVVRHLLARGYRRIALIGGRPAQPGGRPAKAGSYHATLAEAGITPDPSLVVCGDYSRESGMQAMQQLLSLAEPPRAVFAGNDLMAIGALAAARLTGLRVPEDIAIAGYDDIPEAAVTSPTLTTLAVPKYDMGRAAAEVLFRRIQELNDQRRQRGTASPAAGDDAQAAPQRVVLAHRLMIREST